VPVRLLLADDHEMFRESLRMALPKDEFVIVSEAANGRDAVTLAGRDQPDLAVLDFSMPGLNGVDATREVLRVSPSSRVVVLSMHHDDSFLAEALRAGARGYVLKTQRVTELLRALRMVAGGDVYVAPGLLKTVVASYQNGFDPSVDPLTGREHEVLQLVAEGKPTKEIAALLGISVKTAESHRARIMAKLDLHDTASLVRYAIRKGIIQP